MAKGRRVVRKAVAGRGAAVSLVTVAVVVLAILTVFALELSDTQSKSRQDVISRVHERSVLAAALIDSLLHSADADIRGSTRRATAAGSSATARGPDRAFRTLYV